MENNINHCEILQNHDPITEDNVSEKNVIRKFNNEVSHRICSGQVIVSLSTAVKELVENSLDSGAKNIEVRFAAHGSQLVEVKDDGSGIDESNFDRLCSKHHTSKLQEFEDLEMLETFGFRGEALSSLCAVSSLVICTRSGNALHGSRIEYDSNGSIFNIEKNVPRGIGTTVSIRNLFSTLPVRHKEFTKNVKREFNKMINILYAYVLVTPGIRMRCVNETKNSSIQVFCVQALEKTRERIATLFGSKQVASIVEIQDVGNDVNFQIQQEFGLDEHCGSQFSRFSLSGWISQPNNGRSTGDRQFIFINTRPCDYPKICRLVNEVYHYFSRNQTPFLLLQITTSSKDIDVNVTPDKRSIFLQYEKVLLSKIKASLLKTLLEASGDMETQFSLSQSLITVESPDTSSTNEDPQVRADTDLSPEILRPTKAFPSSGSISSFLNQFKCKSGKREVGSHSSSKSRSSSKQSKNDAADSKKLKMFTFVAPSEFKRKQMRTPEDSEDDDGNIEEEESESQPVGEVVTCDEDDKARPRKRVKLEESEEDEGLPGSQDIPAEIFVPTERITKNIRIHVNWKEVLERSNRTMKLIDGKEQTFKFKKFRTEAICPENNEKAENELKRQLTKEMFKKMTIVGQFNLGFIISKLGPDLFIIDQHAADEKQNYEMLAKTVKLEGQRLIIPMPLELPVTSENILIDNLEVFEKNGFSFSIDLNGQPLERVKLIKVPVSKSWTFGKSDIEELIFLLEDAGEKPFYRPSKIHDMFASRACRKSIMFGVNLSRKEMKRLVNRLSELDQPWNCPHGRPTLRHLFNIDLLPPLRYFN